MTLDGLNAAITGCTAQAMTHAEKLNEQVLSLAHIDAAIDEALDLIEVLRTQRSALVMISEMPVELA